ncbi:transmembrane and coiled-coil domain-containing protein 3 isoform X6 [Mirounga angustirostris]|uniref:transmembrane and coiled-coil domain-containing protein 3 isoform X6 n=1 Tax=Mirounga angustirostris TaxID=9716 RepID=UPI00313E40AF
MKVLEKNYFWMLLPLLRLIADAAEHEEVAKHAIKLHRGRGAAITQRKQWVLDSCRKLSGLLRQKTVVLNKLKSAIRAVEKDVSLSDEEKLFQVHTFEIFQKELNESENSVFQAIYGLQRALQGDYRDVVNMKESSRQRLEALREAAIKEETEYVELLAAEKHQVEALKNMQHQNKSLSILDEILEDVRKAADRLEEEIEEHAFDDNKSVKGVNFEAVLRVEEEEANSKQNLTKREVEDDLGLSMLIDSQNNRYILTKPRDATIPRADHHFLKDIVTIGMLSLPCGWLCTTIGLPTMFGYIICGVLLGPSGLNSIKSVVQVETLGEVGVFFTLFLVGLEFSPERLRKVWKIALQGPCYMTLLMIAFGLLWGHLLQIRPTQSVFISTCLSLSSTPLVSRFLVGSARGEKEAGDIDYSAVLLGMLVVQDVQLGLFIAGMPTLIQAAAGTYSSVVMETLRILALVGQILFSLAAAFLLCLVIKTYLIGPYYRKLHMESKGNKEILILGISAFIFLMLMVTELLDISMELGCFLAGALISSQGHMVTEEVVSYIEPIRDFLVIIFFASIGLHVFPTFVVYELTILMVLTLSVVIMKGVRRGLASVFCSAGRLGRGSNGSLSQFALAALVLSLLLPKSSQYVKWIVAAGLAQVSELSFVLGSRARRAGIISREVSLHPRCVFGEPRPAPPTLPSEHPARGSAAGAGPALCLSPSADDYCRCRRCPVPSRISGGRRAKSQGPPPLVCARPPWDRV